LIEAIRNLFRRKRKDEVKTTPLSEEQLKEVVKPIKNAGALQLIPGVARNLGKQRDHNEDSLFSLSSYISEGSRETPFGIFVIADGMGGHLFGDVASNVAIKAFSRNLLEKLILPMFNNEPQMPTESLQEIMEASVSAAQTAVQKYAPSGGTTLTAALVLGEQVTIAHVGDSRAYFIYPDGRTQKLTYDHSLVHRLVELGQIEEKDAKTHPQRNVLYRAIGQAEPYKPDIATFQLPHPGKILLCSDGLWNVVSDEEIFKIIISSHSVTDACNDLVNSANSAGGPDNISVILVDILM
jgi:serine/threonine protein phosphatase PrpC